MESMPHHQETANTLSPHATNNCHTPGGTQGLLHQCKLWGFHPSTCTRKGIVGPSLTQCHHTGFPTAFPTASSDSFTSVTCAHCKPALICEESGEPVEDLAILVFNWQIPIKLHMAGLWAQVPLEYVGPHATLMAHEFGQKHAHQKPAGGHFEGFWQWSSHHTAGLLPFYPIMDVPSWRTWITCVTLIRL